MHITEMIVLRSKYYKTFHKVTVSCTLNRYKSILEYKKGKNRAILGVPNTDSFYMRTKQTLDKQ